MNAAFSFNQTRRRDFIAMCAAVSLAPAAPAPAMLWGDTSRLGRPFSKDPSVIRWRDRYLLYYSLPPFADGRTPAGWGVGIAESRNLTDWKPVAEVQPEFEYERKGLAAPHAYVYQSMVHLFYQTYGNGPADAICHATSKDGIRFQKDPSNPIFHTTGAWNAGRAIDADVCHFRGKTFLYAATRDPAMKVQMITGAFAPISKGFGRDAWTQLADRPLLAPELPWEKDCMEAPSVVERDGGLYMFYAGGYNNAPQQIGVARSTDGVEWRRLSREPFLPVGPSGAWNSSESGHPGVFTDRDGSTYLFYQGNPDNGRTWLLSYVRIGWRREGPVLLTGR